MKIIGLNGLPGAGKDTVADHLVAKHGFTKRGFADPLYEEVAQAFDVTVDWLRDRTRKELVQPELMLNNALVREPEFVYLMRDAGVPPNRFLSPRQVLQQWGTEYRRAQNGNYWIDQMVNFLESRPVVVIPDCRFLNEADLVRDLGGTLVRVVRPSTTGSPHASDAPFPAERYDAEIHNYGGIPGLLLAADFIATNYTDGRIVQ